MGWDSCETWKSAAEALKSVDAGRSEWKLLARTKVARGARVWSVYASKDERFIVCDLFERDGHGSGRTWWMTKSVAAAEGPFYFDCPLDYLGMAGGTTSLELAWRYEVRLRAKVAS